MTGEGGILASSLDSSSFPGGEGGKGGAVCRRGNYGEKGDGRELANPVSGG